MEIELKLRLQDSTAHQKLIAVLSPHRRKTLTQENIFFDTSRLELARAGSALRLRFCNLDSECFVALKSNAKLSSGVSRVEELEEAVEPGLGRACVEEPGLVVGMLPAGMLDRVTAISRNGLTCLGGFKNVRQVFEWEGLKLEVDETGYEFGCSYEVECETPEPEKARSLLEALLRDHNIPFSYATANKFAVFMSRKLPPWP